MIGNKKGNIGEETAAKYLMSKGYTHLQSNLKVGHDEIDLLMQDGRTYVFVEVKLRAAGGGAAAVDKRKQARISKAAITFLYENGLLEQPARFDVVEIAFKDVGMDITHYENAFPVIRGRFFF